MNFIDNELRKQIMYSKFASAHSYARRNGYKGTYDEYIKLQFDAYKSTCKRCEIKPMEFHAWLAQ